MFIPSFSAVPRQGHGKEDPLCSHLIKFNFYHLLCIFRAYLLLDTTCAIHSVRNDEQDLG